MADYPIGEHASAAAARYRQFVGIHPAALNQVVNSGHQILVVVAGVMVLDDVAKILSIGRTAARIGIQDDIAFGRHPLELVVEGVSIGGMRATMNIQNHRILLAFLKIGRALYPGLNSLSVKAVVPNHRWFSQIELRKELLIDMREPFHMPVSAIGKI